MEELAQCVDVPHGWASAKQEDEGPLAVYQQLQPRVVLGKARWIRGWVVIGGRCLSC